MKKLRKPNWLVIALLTGAVLLVAAGLALLGAYVHLSRQAAASSSLANPLDAVRADAVAPDLAVLTLAGETDDRVMRAALDAGELETAYATVVYSLLLPDALRSGHWALLSGRYQSADEGKAAICYQAILDQAALSPGLSDVARADASIQAGVGFAALGRDWAAKLSLAQAESIARYSLTMLPAQRRSTLSQIIVAYRNLGDKSTADAIQAGLETASTGPGATLEPAPLALPALRGSVVLPPTVTATVVARQAAAANLAARWLSSPASARTGLGEALGKALEAEDDARAAFFVEATALSAADRLALLHDRVAWLTVKYRAARGAYGATLVPAWNGQSEPIRAELAAAYTDLINGYGQQLDTLTAGDALQARVELLRQGLLWTRLGFFPDSQAEALLGEQLIEAARQLWTRQSGAGLAIIVQQSHGQRFYLLSGAETPRSGAVQ